MLKEARRAFMVLSICDWLFTALGFMLVVNPPFNPIAIYFWSGYGLLGWTAWKIANASFVYITLGRIYNRCTNKTVKFSVIFAFCGLIITLMGAILQEWFFIGWIDFAPASLRVLSR